MLPALRVAVLVIVLASAAPARAQFILGSAYPAAYGNRFTYGGGLGFSYHHRHLRIAGFAGGFGTRSGFGAPYGSAFGYPLVSSWGVLPPVSMLTPFGWSAGFLPAGWGVGPGWGAFTSPPVIVVPPPIILAGGGAEERKDDSNPALGFEDLPKPIDPLPRGARAGQYIVIKPKPAFPAPGQIEPQVDRVAAAPRPRAPEIHFDPFAKPVKVAAEPREADPLKEAARLVKLGRAAFAAGEYGHAAEQFERASALNPKLALPHFLQAQAAFAAGRFADATTAIHAGLKLDPAWPASTFDPKEPYGASAAAFATHLAELRKAVAENPGEPTLEFLLGYELWFVGEKTEARKWLDLAARRLRDGEPVGLFK